MSLTSSFTTQAGIVTVTFDTTATGTFEVVQMGAVEYDFDLTNYGSAVSKVGVVYNRSSIVCGQYTKGGGDLYQLVYDHVFDTPGTPLPVSVSIALHDGSLAAFRFLIQSRSLSRRVNDTTVRFDLDPMTETELTIGDLFGTSYATDVSVGVYNGVTSGIGMLIGNVIDYVISGLNPSLPRMVSSSYQNAANHPSTMYPVISGLAGLTDGTEYVFVVSGSVDSTSAIDAVRNYAVLEGSIYGTGFDRNFYVHRTRTDDASVLLDDDVEMCESETVAPAYSSISLTLDSLAPGSFSNIPDVTRFAFGNTGAEKSISGVFPFYGAGKGRWDSPNDWMDQTDVDTVVKSEELIVASGLLSHRTALNATTTPAFRIRLSSFGIGNIKPYQSVTLSGTTFPHEFRFAPSGGRRYYRPTFLSYDIYEDKVTARLYSISE